VKADDFMDEYPKALWKAPKLTVSNVVIYVGLTICFWGALSLPYAPSFSEVRQPPALSELRLVEGTMKKISLGRSSGLAVTDNSTDKRYVSHGYANDEKDLEKKVKFWVGKRKVYQIEVDGNLKTSYLNEVEKDKVKLSSGILNILIGAAICFMAVIYKIKTGGKINGYLR